MPQQVHLASSYDQGANKSYALAANQTFTQRLKILTPGRPTLLGLWLGNNQNPFDMRLEVRVNERPVLDRTYTGLRQRRSDWAVPLDLSTLASPLNVGDWVSFSITPNQSIGFSPVLVDSPDWPRSTLYRYGSVAARFFLEGMAIPKLHSGRPVRYPGLPGNARYPNPALLMFALSDEGLPLVARAVGDGWETAPIESAQEPLGTLAPVIAADGSIHLFGALRADQLPVLAAWMDPAGAWHPGVPIRGKGPLTEFVPMIDGCGCTWVAALSKGGAPLVTRYNYWEQRWSDFCPLKARVPLRSLAGLTAGPKAYVLGISDKNGQAHEACVLEGEKWRPGEALSPGGPLSALAKAVDGHGNLWVIGLGTDHAPRIAARFDAQGVRHPGTPLNARGNLSAVAAGADPSGDVHVFGLDAAGQQVVPVSRLDARSQQWGPPRPIPAQANRSTSLWATRSESGSLLAMGCGVEDGQPFIACSL
jgi:hypothetical protein